MNTFRYPLHTALAHCDLFTSSSTFLFFVPFFSTLLLREEKKAIEFGEVVVPMNGFLFHLIFFLFLIIHLIHELT